jgi:tRNA pseudouridine38-40 synthase
MRNFKLTVAYDGSNYFGWQAQADKVTIQQTLEAAVAQIIGEKIRLHASGRTDTGVHALGQVASFQSDTNLQPNVLQKALNAVLPDDIVVRDVCEVPAEFHPRYSAKRKHYRYSIYNGLDRSVFFRPYSWYFKKGTLDAESMHRAAQPLLGKHDFSSFESSGAKRKTSIRSVDLLQVRRGMSGQKLNSICREPRMCVSIKETATECGLRISKDDLFFVPLCYADENWIIFDIIADGFLYNMVRAIVGTLVEVGRGAQSESWPNEVLQAGDRRRAGPTAPPQGLFLMNVRYTDDA